MNQQTAEKILCILYIIVTGCSLITSITSGVVWGHWRWTLDQCNYTPGYNCSCILYGEATPNTFHGGNMWTCMWIIFGPIPIILISIVYACYHGIRICVGSKTEATRSVMTKNESGEMIHMQIHTTEPSNDIARAFWITAASVCSVFAVYMLIHFSIFTDGYLHTCKQYKRKLVDMLRLDGQAVGVVHNRITCNAVYDFMDYLQPSYNYIERYNFINTAAALIIGMITSFIATSALTAASFINIKFSRNN